MGGNGVRPRKRVKPKAGANRLAVPRASHVASTTTYQLALASLACGIVPVGLGLIAIVSHRYSGFFLFGWVPAFAELGIALTWQGHPDKRIRRIGGFAFVLSLLGMAAVAWATGWQDWGNG